MDIRCISWTLQTSLDKPIHLLALRYLATVVELTIVDPILVADCFSVFISCISTSNYEVVVRQGLEQLAPVSARCFFRTFHHLLATDPTSNILTDLRRRYKRIFPFATNFKDIPFYHTMVMIDVLVAQRQNQHYIWWGDDRPSDQEHALSAQYMAEAARVGYQQTQCRKVYRWILRFVLDSLSLDPPPSASVIADCLTIIATDLGDDHSSIKTLDERYVNFNVIGSSFLTKE